MAEEVVTTEGTQPAPVTQPVVQSTPAVTTEPDKGKPAPDKVEAGEPITYEATGDAKLDVALSFFGRAGLDAEHPAIQAAVTGDFSLLAAYLEEKNIPGWQSHVKLAEEAHAKYAEQNAAAETAIVDAVSGALEKAGYTNEQWGEAIGWARENADPHELAELNEMLSKPFSAKIAVGYLTGLHRDASGVEYTPQKGAVKEDAGVKSGRVAQETTKITRAEFAREAEKLSKAYGGGAYMNSPEYAALRKRVQ